MVLGVPSGGSTGAGTAAASIQSHMEKYLTDADSVNDYEGDSDGNSNGDEGDTARCNSRPRSRGVGSSSGRLSTTSGHHHVTSGADCKTETFLHSDGQSTRMYAANFPSVSLHSVAIMYDTESLSPVSEARFAPAIHLWAWETNAEQWQWCL